MALLGLEMVRKPLLVWNSSYMSCSFTPRHACTEQDMSHLCSGFAETEPDRHSSPPAREPPAFATAPLGSRQTRRGLSDRLCSSGSAQRLSLHSVS